MQMIIRSTPVLFAKQLEITEHLVIEATQLFIAKFSDSNTLSFHTVNAIIRSAFACLHAMQCSNAKHLADQVTRDELNALMSNLRPSILSKTNHL